MMKMLMTAMTTSISEVMETMFYLPVEFGEETDFSDSEIKQYEPFMACRLGFSGTVSGHLTLLVPKDLLSDLTENFMGMSREKLEEVHLSGTLTEMLNMIGGNALSKVDSKTPFELDIPEVIENSTILDTDAFTIIRTTQSIMALHMATVSNS